MATKKRIRFDFGSADNIALSRKGEFPCRICHRSFVVPEIDITILGFTICPSCIHNGPQFVAAQAERTAVDKDLIARTFEYTDSSLDQKDAASMAKLYRSLASALRGLHSFYDIPGGAVAIKIACVKPEDLRRGYRRKAA